ncbi:hypothetical protein CN404_30525 [Bacillus thuringiensis]|nr:hypothetical protein CN404_30525 [Bacillus thuringiensis]
MCTIGFRLFLKLKARYYSLTLMRKGDVLFMNMHQKQELSIFRNLKNGFFRSYYKASKSINSFTKNTTIV